MGKLDMGAEKLEVLCNADLQKPIPNNGELRVDATWETVLSGALDEILTAIKDGKCGVCSNTSSWEGGRSVTLSLVIWEDFKPINSVRLAIRVVSGRDRKKRASGLVLSAIRHKG